MREHFLFFTFAFLLLLASSLIRGSVALKGARKALKSDLNGESVVFSSVIVVGFIES